MNDFGNRFFKEAPFMGALFFLVIAACVDKKEPLPLTSQDERSQFTEPIKDYYLTTLDSLASHINRMDSSKNRTENQEIFLEVRRWYKFAEPIIIAFDHTNYLTLNGPNLPVVHAEDFTEIKILKAKGLQVVEELLFMEEEYDKNELHLQLLFLKARVPFIAHNHLLLNQRDRHYLKMIRDAIVTVATKGITGFDSPALLNSMNESAYVYESISNITEICKEAFNDHTLYKEWVLELNSSIDFLRNSDFDGFDRYSFIKEHTNKQLDLINQVAIDWNIELAKSRPLNPTATNLFSPKFFNMENFAPATSPAVSSELVSLGRTLFNDQRLSQSGDMSCASCHQRSKGFTDGLALAVGNKQKPLQRNSPTIAYSALQRSFFYEGRSSALESQILGVMNNADEFHIDAEKLEEKIAEDPEYRVQFANLYNGEMSNVNVRSAIGTYIRSLAPFDSKFDRNMQNKESTLSDEEVLGFNLFMGKAACATCHFPPSFFGTVPPSFAETELENLGVPANNSFTDPILDTDPGAYEPYKVEERRGFFKTSTVRNIALTAPYMHNGVYNTLEEVLTFYNVGGGLGMGLDVPYQTLPPDSLQLTDAEQQAIIAFMRTLTDAEFEELPETAGGD